MLSSITNDRLLSPLSATGQTEALPHDEGATGGEVGSGAVLGRDNVAISDEARDLLRQDEERSERDDEGGLGQEELTEEEKKQVKELQARDREVRAHEQAHKAVAGALGGAPTYSYQTGPDGKRYAVGGEVQISLREGRTPQETLANAERVVKAALAPAEPSGQDQRVASRARSMAREARAEIQEEKRAERGGQESEGSDNNSLESIELGLLQRGLI